VLREEEKMSSLRRLVLHPSLIRPRLLAGGDRVLVTALWTAVLLLIFGARTHWLTLTYAVVLGGGGQWALIRAAKADPHWFTVYWRHLAYQDVYPAHRHLLAPPAQVRSAVPTLKEAHPDVV
jgi:type IV secretion system protein TrbD